MEDASPATPAGRPRAAGSRRARPAAGLALGAALLAGAGAGGCSPFIGTTAASFLRRVRTDPDPNVRYLAYTKLAQTNVYDNAAQRDEVVKTLLDKFDHGNEPIGSRAAIIHALGALGSPAARDLVVRAASDPEAVIRVQACRALGRVGRPEDATILARVMATDTLEDCRIAAIESMGRLKSTDPRIAKVLVDGMQHDDPATRLASLDALRRVTGKDLGVEPGPWLKMIEPEALVAGKDKATKDGAVAAAANGGHPLTAPVPTPAPGPVLNVYPPKPAPVPKTDLSKDPYLNPVDLTPKVSPTTPTPGQGTSSYPGTNPNLAPR